MKISLSGRKAKRVYLLIGLPVCFIFAIVVMLTARSTTATASGSYLWMAENIYPRIVGSDLDSCDLCHIGIPDLNPYGRDFKLAGSYEGAFTAIESLDSDGDGFTNLEEIKAKTFPGDPDSHPFVATPTHLLPTATATQTPTASRHLLIFLPNIAQ